MEQNFQTSFIPKKPIVNERVTYTRPMGFLIVVSILMVLAVAIATGVLYVYKGIVNKNIAEMKKNLDLAKNRFEPAKIAELQLLGKRIEAANQVLSKHIAISPIFEALQLITMKQVRYTKFSYDFKGDEGSKVDVKMSGVATGYSVLALQSDLFAQNENVIDPVFSNLALNETGNVTFELSFSVDPSFVDYKLMLSTKAEDDGGVLDAESGSNIVAPAVGA